jgi:hypothetical protein
MQICTEVLPGTRQLPTNLLLTLETDDVDLRNMIGNCIFEVSLPTLSTTVSAAVSVCASCCCLCNHHVFVREHSPR